MLAHALLRDRAWIVAHGDAFAPDEAEQRFIALCDERAAGTPIAYLVGSVGFCGREFVVDERVLIPRPETEHLVEEALKFLQARRLRGCRPPFAVLDIGVGSGAIACTIAAQFSDANVDCVDLSSDALTVARINAERLDVAGRCRFHHGAYVQPVTGRRFALVVANLPYVPAADLPRKPDPLAFEPRIALDGGRDGLAAYRELLMCVPESLEPEGMLLLEGAPPQMRGLLTLAEEAFPTGVIGVGYDYARQPRYVKVLAPPA
ncbi:MAG: peptide chain release factor N(5)-glutamine methyltransferase [Candidatus Eremiobacteraeota bacterium]|nr:peptide chain release factor N(5)-glutamine methyltransferase [Candidatus Eremiobacteraeota bacterium]